MLFHHCCSNNILSHTAALSVTESVDAALSVAGIFLKFEKCWSITFIYVRDLGLKMRRRKEKDPDYRPGATHNKGRSTYYKESQSIKAQLNLLKGAGDVCSSQGSLDVEEEVEEEEEEELKVDAPTAAGDGVDETKSGVRANKKGKRTGKGWSKHKKGAKSRGQQDTERRERVDEKIAKIKKAREDLNPYDEMDIDTKKNHALFHYNDMMADILSENEVAFSSKSVAVKKKVAKKVGVSVRSMQRWVLDYWCEEEVTKSKRGKHSKVESPLDDPEFRAAFSQYVRSHAKPKGRFC